MRLSAISKRINLIARCCNWRVFLTLKCCSKTAKLVFRFSFGFLLSWLIVNICSSFLAHNVFSSSDIVYPFYIQNTTEKNRFATVKEDCSVSNSWTRCHYFLVTGDFTYQLHQLNPLTNSACFETPLLLQLQPKQQPQLG